MKPRDHSHFRFSGSKGEQWDQPDPGDREPGFESGSAKGALGSQFSCALMFCDSKPLDEQPWWALLPSTLLPQGFSYLLMLSHLPGAVLQLQTVEPLNLTSVGGLETSRDCLL